MRGGHKFQTSDFVGGDSSLPPLIGTSKVTGPGVTKECPQERRRFRKKIEEPGCSSQPQRRPFRPRRGVGVEPESTDSGEINEELKAWICARRVSVCFNNANDAPTVVANDVPTVQTLSPEATILEADQLATAVKAVFHMSVGENSGFPRVEEAPMTTGLNLLAQEVENASGVDQEDSELVDNTLALVLAKPKTFVLPSQQDFVESDEVGTSVPDETNSENKETASPTNSEDYKTPPEESPTAESRTPEGGNVLNRRYSTRLTKIQEGEWKCISLFYTFDLKDEGLVYIKRSADGGPANPSLPNLPDEIMSKIIELVGEESSWPPPINKPRGRGGNQIFGAQFVGIFYVCIGEDMKASHVFQQFAVNHVDLRSDAIFEMGDELESRLSSFHVRYLNSHDATFKFPDNDVIKTPRCLYGHDYMVDFEGICKNCRLFWICFNISHML
ncbi:unnamed protein product [Brassica oleracea var. botrytis]|uniref:Uncharacterized protein n=2 Tax=Brassica TaxID=3705 RepID=A0A3P6FSY6_BRAOL|nr:unnamed protein product [Brassica napus]CDY17543.1 BnaC01g26670D [Brassica napus]VDD51014.1 unnamed protein product [Brassica oleracea]